MKHFVDKLKESHIGIFVAVFHHLFIGLYLWKIATPGLFEGRSLVLLLCVFFLQVALYMVSLIMKGNKKLLLYLKSTVIAIIWQFLLSISTSDSYQLFLKPITPIGLYLLIFSSISIITIGQERLFKELFQVAGALALLSSGLSIFISNPLIPFFASSFILLSPVVLLFMYRKEMMNLPQVIRHRLNIFTLVSAVLLFAVFWISLPILVWLLSICILMLILHFKIIMDIIQRKISAIKEIYIQFSIKVVVTIFLVVIGISVILQFDYQSNYIFINGMVLLLFLIGVEFVYFLESPKFIEENKQLKALLTRNTSIIKEFLEDESNKQVFSEYLHNEILQNIIAIKNYSSYSGPLDVRNEIQTISQEMIQSIRATLDSYQPVLDKKFSLLENYRRLIKRVTTHQAFEGSLEVDFPSDFHLPRPYDLLLYRFIEELLTNACKYGKTRIDLKVVFENQIIQLMISNDVLDKEHFVEPSGYGLNFIHKRLQVLGGEMKVTEEHNRFHVVLSLPLEKEFCYEDFIN